MSEPTIERLQVEIESDSTSAASGIDALASSLDKLKNALKGGAGLNTFSKQLATLNTALSSVSSTNTDTLDKLARSLQTLSSLGSLKLSSSISTQITSLGSAVRSLDGANFGVLTNLVDALMPLSSLGKANLNSFISQLTRLPQAVAALGSTNFASFSTQINQLVSALAPLSSMGKNNLTSFITQLSKLPALMTSLQSIDMGTLTSQIQALANAFAPLATQMQHISAGFASFPARIQKLIASTNKLSSSNDKAAKSYVNLAAKIGIATVAMRKIVSVLGSWITKSNKYIEDMNLFTASMGEFAEKAQEYAEHVGEIMGIDPGQWMRNQGVFMTLATGFGVASDRAEIMSRNLTQLGYDIGSFFNISFEDAMLKLQSGLAGELEPLRRIGYDLSVARLQQEAYTLGIKKKVQAMTQAEKAELRYYAILTQVTVAQGDMARTLDAPSNQLRILSAQIEQAGRALGNIFIPMLNAVLPYAIAFAKVIRIIANEIASLFGYSFPEVDYSGVNAISGAGGGISDAADALGDAADNAKKLKNNLLGIDELNIISKDEDSAGSGIGNAVGGGGLGFELPEYDFLGDAVSARVDEIMAKLQPFIDWFKSGIGWIKDNFNEALATVLAIGGAIAAWKVAQGVLSFLKYLQGLKGKNLSYSIGFTIAGLGLFLDAWNTMKEAIQDILDNGANFTNVTKLLSGFAEGLGAAFILLGNLKLGGAMLIISGILGIVSDISDMVKNGINWDNAMSLVKNIGLFVAGIGLAFGNLQLGGIGLMISGAALIIKNFQALVTGFTTGDWSNVEWIEVAAGALLLIGGLIIAFKKIGTIADVASIGKASETITTVSTETGNLDTSMGKLSPKLTSLAKNLAIGLVIVVEVAAAAILITGAIWVLGKELEQVGLAWQPVIDNGGTIAIAMGIGVGILAAIGVVTALLGSVGTTLIVNMALGIAILAELGIAAGLFLVEIWAIGKGLDEIGKAWEPVLSNGDSIATAIGLGTALLVAIGVVTAALGMATVATAGLLPLAIGLGTAILLEMGVATALFIVEIVAIGKLLEEVGRAWAPVLANGKTIETGIATGTALLIAIGVVTAALGVATVASAGLLPLAIGLGTALLVELAAATILFTESLVAVADEMSNRLSPALIDLNGKLPTLSTNMSNFVTFMTEFAGYVVTYSKANAISGLAATIDTIIGWFTTDPLEKLANDVNKIYTQGQGLNQKLNLAVPELETAIALLKKYTTFIKEIETLTGSSDNSSLSNGVFVNMKDVGANLVTGFVSGIRSKSSDFKNAGSDIIKGFTSGVDSSKNDTLSKMKEFSGQVVEAFKKGSGKGLAEEFKEIGNSIVTGFKDKINSTYSSSKSSITTWATSVKNWFTEIASKTAFEGFATSIVDAFKNRIASYYTSSRSSITTWATSVTTWFKESCSVTAFSAVATEIVDAFKNRISEYSPTSKTSLSTWGSSIAGWFKETCSADSFYKIAKDVIDGFNRGINDFYTTTRPYMTKWANDAIRAYKDALDSNSPSKVFYRIGGDSILGYNNAIANLGSTTKKLVTAWANSFTDVSPTMVMSVDTSALQYYDSKSFAKTVSPNVSSTAYTSVTAEGFKEAIEEFYEEFISPMADDVRRQADKEEQTIVQVGNRTVTDAVTTQRRANGYQFVTV